jgi:hypothetical protein
MSPVLDQAVWTWLRRHAGRLRPHESADFTTYGWRRPSHRYPHQLPIGPIPGVRALGTWRAARSVAPLSLLAPGVAVVVVAEALPEAGLVLVKQLDSMDHLALFQR